MLIYAIFSVFSIILCPLCTGVYQPGCSKSARYGVRGPTFVYFLDDHHGDGPVAVCSKALPGDRWALQGRLFAWSSVLST